MEHKKHYISPCLTVVRFKTERGFAISGLIDQMLFWEEETDGANDQVQSYTRHNDWSNDAGNSFWSED